MMICDKCKINEATVVVRHAINGKASTFHFCEKCAREQGLASGRMMLKIPMPTSLGLVIPPGTQIEREQSLRNRTLDREFEEMIVEPMEEQEKTGGSLLERRLEGLRKEKQIAIKNEDYKSAANLRDRIKELEKKISE